MTEHRVRLFLKLATVAWLLLGIAGTIPALFSVFLLDAPGSSENIATMILFWSVISFPLVCFSSVPSAWKKFRTEAYTSAFWIACLPVLNGLAGGAAFAWIMLMQGGKFNG